MKLTNHQIRIMCCALAAAVKSEEAAIRLQRSICSDKHPSIAEAIKLNQHSIRQYKTLQRRLSQEYARRHEDPASRSA